MSGISIAQSFRLAFAASLEPANSLIDLGRELKSLGPWTRKEASLSEITLASFPVRGGILKVSPPLGEYLCSRPGFGTCPLRIFTM